MNSFDLRSVDLFSGLDDGALARLSSDVTTCVLLRGATLFEEGGAGDTAYVVTSGEIEILKASADQSVRIAISGPGQIVGEMSLLTGEPQARRLVRSVTPNSSRSRKQRSMPCSNRMSA